MPASVVSCPTSTFCVTAKNRTVATWANGSVHAHRFSLPSMNLLPGGIGDQTFPQLNTDYITSVSCASPQMCVAVTAGGYAIEFGRGHWGPVSRVTTGGLNELNAVTCASNTFCLAGSSTDEAYIFDGRSWQWVGSPDPAEAGTNAGAEITAVACPQVGLCFVASALTDPMSGDYSGSVYRYANGAWSASSSSVSYAISALACSDQYDCVAGTANGLYLRMFADGWGDPFPVSMDNGSLNPARIIGASCSRSAGQCYLLNDNGEVYPTTGVSQTLLGTRAFLGFGSGLDAGLSCAPSGACFVVDGWSLFEARL